RRHRFRARASPPNRALDRRAVGRRVARSHVTLSRALSPMALAFPGAERYTCHNQTVVIHPLRTGGCPMIKHTIQLLGPKANGPGVRQKAPSPQRAVVSGTLDELKGSKRAFTLKLSSGDALPGLLPPGDPSSFAPLFTKKVVVDGEVKFRPSGAA